MAGPDPVLGSGPKAMVGADGVVDEVPDVPRMRRAYVEQSRTTALLINGDPCRDRRSRPPRTPTPRSSAPTRRPGTTHEHTREPSATAPWHPRAHREIPV